MGGGGCCVETTVDRESSNRPIPKGETFPRNGPEQHGPGHDPAGLAGGRSLRLRAGLLGTTLAVSLPASLSCPPPASLVAHVGTTEQCVRLGRNWGNPDSIIWGWGAFQTVLHISSHLILPTVTRRKLKLIVLPPGFLRS